MPRFCLHIGSLALLITGVSVFPFFLAQAEDVPPAVIPNYAAAPSLEFSGVTAFQPNGQELFITATLKNISPVEEAFSLGVDFVNYQSTTKDRLYTVRLPVPYTLAGNETRQAQFNVPIPSFLSGTYTVQLGADNSAGHLAGLQSVTEIVLVAGERARLEQCALADQSFDQPITLDLAAAASADIVCQGSWSGTGSQPTTILATLASSRYGAAREIASEKQALNSTKGEVKLNPAEALPVGKYRLAITAVDEQGFPIGLPVTTLITVQGRGGQIVGIAETNPETKGGKTVIPVSVLVDTYGAGNYSLALTLTADSQACAAALTLPVSPATRQFAGEFTVTSDCPHPIITATLSAEGAELDRATRVLDTLASRPGVTARHTITSSTLIGLAFAVLFGLIVAGYFFWRSRRTSFMPVLFLFAAAAFFGNMSEIAQAGDNTPPTNHQSYDIVNFCNDAECDGDAITLIFSIPETLYTPGEPIAVIQLDSHGDFPLGGPNYSFDVRMQVNAGPQTGDLINDAGGTPLPAGHDITPTLNAPNTNGPFTLTITSIIRTSNPSIEYSGQNTVFNFSVAGAGAPNPPPPTGLVAVPQQVCGATQDIRVSWNVTVNQTYTLLVDSGLGFSELMTGAVSEFMHKGLPAASTHKYRLFTTSSTGSSPAVATNPVDTTVPPAVCVKPPPPNPSIRSATPGPCVVSGNGTIDVVWNDVSAPGYPLTYTLRAGANVLYSGTGTTFPHKDQFPPVTPGTTHDYWLTSTYTPTDPTNPANPYMGTSVAVQPTTPNPTPAPPICTAASGPCDFGCAGSMQYRLNAASPTNTFTCPAGTKTVTTGGSWSTGACAGTFTRDPNGGTFSCIQDISACPPLPPAC
jgi:hypothetical protein